MKVHSEFEGLGEPEAGPRSVEDRVRTYLDVSHRVGDRLLEALDRVCTEHDVSYFLTSGTLLGAVRHGGWIDWDDDVDVVMFREDFEKFRRIAPGQLPADMAFSDGLSNREHITSIPRVLFTSSHRRPSGRTRARRPVETRHIALDIFVLDLAPERAFSRKLWMQAAYLLERVAVARMTSLSDVAAEPGLPLPRRLAELAALAVSRVLPHEGWHRLRDRLIRYREGRVADGPYMAANYSTPHGRTCIFGRQWYFPAGTGRFGTEIRPIPRDPGAVLAELFGPTYLTPPPSAERQPIHIRNGLHVDIDGRSWDIAPD